MNFSENFQNSQNNLKNNVKELRKFQKISLDFPRFLENIQNPKMPKKPFLNISKAFQKLSNISDKYGLDQNLRACDWMLKITSAVVQKNPNSTKAI